MNSTPHTGDAEAVLFARRHAIYLGAALLAGLTLVLIFTALDRSRRTQLEATSQTTAVGDRAFFLLPQISQKPPGVAANFRGQPLYPISYARVEIRDSRMTQAGSDDSGTFRIYTTREHVPLQDGEIDKPGEPVYFLKTAPDEYVKVRPSTPGK
jgi:hypothetical protein